MDYKPASNFEKLLAPGLGEAFHRSVERTNKLEAYSLVVADLRRRRKVLLQVIDLLQQL